LNRQLKAGPVSLIDIVTVAAVVVFIVLARKFSAPQEVTAAPGSVTLRYTVELQKKQPDFADKVQVGAKVYDSQQGYHIGEITGVSTGPYMEDAPDHDDLIIRRTAVEGLYSVYVDIEAQAVVTDQTTSIGPFDVLIGKEIYIRTKDFASGGYVIKRVVEE
jgi:hypothetical protein